MAVAAVIGSPSGAINYTFTTDTSADFPSVANSTYFYNKADKLVRYKDSTGAILEIFAATPNVVKQAATTSANQYQAAAGSGSTMLFSSKVIQTAGQIIDFDFLIRNTTNIGAVIRIYASPTESPTGGTQIGFFVFDTFADLTLRYTHKFVVIRDSLSFSNYFLIGIDGFIGNTDLVYAANEYFASYSLGSSTLLEKTFIVLTLNQSASLIAASISY